MMFIQKIYREYEGEPVSKIANHLQGGIVSGLKLVHSSAQATAIQPEEGEGLTQFTLSIKKRKNIAQQKSTSSHEVVGVPPNGTKSQLVSKILCCMAPPIRVCQSLFFFLHQYVYRLEPSVLSPTDTRLSKCTLNPDGVSLGFIVQT